MDPISMSLVAGLGIGLYKAFEKVAEKAVIDPALENGLEPFKKWLTKGYDQQKDTQELNDILLAALDDLRAQYQQGDPERLIVTLKLTSLTQEQHTALAAAAVEMSQPESTLVPMDLLKSLELEEERREMLARFLFFLRRHLADSEKYKVAIDYASDLDRRGLLAGLSQQLLDLQKQASTQISLLDTLVTLHHLTSDDKQALQSYLDWARQRWGSLTLPLIRKRSGDTMHANLKQVFVPLLMRDLAAEEQERLKNRSGQMQKEKIKEISPIGLGELVRRYPRFILIGSPGCGKTTLLHRLALAFAEGRAADDLGWDKKPLLPIFTRLRNFGAFLAQNKDKYPAPCSGSLVAYLENQVRDGERIHLTPDFFDRRLKEGDCLVLLDGLDEVSENRSEVAQHIYAFIEYFGAAPDNCFGISSRPRGYETVEMELRPANLAAADVHPLDEAGIHSLILNLFSLIEPNRQQQLKDTNELTQNILCRQDLIEIASTPLFCSALVQVYKFHGANLPQRRVDVLDEIVDLLLGFWKAQQSMANAVGLATEGTGKPRRLEEAVSVKRARLSFLAYRMQEQHIVEIKTAAAVDLLAGYLEERERVKDKETCCEWAEEFLINSHEHSGLLVEQAPGKYAFLHKNFMEFLAATWLVNRGEVIPVTLEHLADDWWEQVILLAGAHPNLAENIRSDLVNQILDQAAIGDKDETAKTNYIVWAGKLAADMAESLPGPEHERVEETLLSGLNGPELSAKNRARAGDTLAYLGDPRFDPDQYYLPKEDLLGFVHIPAGKFIMGSDPEKDKQAEKNEQPQSSFYLGEFYIAKYPVTVAQFRVFVEKSGHKPGSEYSLQDLPNHPIRYVTWDEAIKYCQWLDETLRKNEYLSLGLKEKLDAGWHINLPSEAEWEKAARGIDDRIYPWIGTFDPNKANVNETEIDSTSAVGCFSGGTSPYGALDMSGNVWQWTRSIWGKEYQKPDYGYPYSERLEERENLKANRDELRVLRGGSFGDNSKWARCAFRFWSPWKGGDFNLGFRIILSPTR